MPGRWDTSTKRLVNTRPEDFIRWLIPEAEFLGPVEAKSLNLNNQEMEVNLHFRIIGTGERDRQALVTKEISHVRGRIKRLLGLPGNLARRQTGRY